MPPLKRLRTERPDLLNGVSELELAALAQRLFPQVAEHRGCFIIADALDSPHLNEWFSGEYMPMQIEYVLNHVHVWDVLEGSQVSDDRAEALRDVMASIWRWWLPQQSTAALTVWTAEDGEEYGPTLGWGHAVAAS